MNMNKARLAEAGLGSPPFYYFLKNNIEGVRSGRRKMGRTLSFFTSNLYLFTQMMSIWI